MEQQHHDDRYVDVDDDSSEHAPLNPSGNGNPSSAIGATTTTSPSTSTSTSSPPSLPLPLPPASSSSTSFKTPIWYEFSTVRRTYGQFEVLGSVKRFFYALIPSWITTHAATTPSKSGISALDGLRGLACLFVFNEHYVICYQSRDTQVWLMRVPFIRLLWYGKAAVFLFFVISGYVLSVKPLRLMRAKAYLDFHKTISSSFLRRGIRLYLPCMIVSLVACVLTSMGFFDRSTDVYLQYRSFVFLKEQPPKHLDGFGAQFAGYLTNVGFLFSGTIPWDMDTDVLHYFMYDDHQWTIPKEFRSSIAVFALLVTTSRMRSGLRMLTIAALAVYAIATARLYVSLFMAGMICAELDLVRQAYYARCKEQDASLPEFLHRSVSAGSSSNSGGGDVEKALPSSSSRSRYTGLETLMHLPDLVYKTMWIGMFTLGVFMISSPQEIQRTLNYLPSLLLRWGVPPYKIDNTLLVIGSVLVVWSTATCPSLGPLFNNPFITYLGKISYALYLMHGTVIKSLGYNVLPWTLYMATWTPWEVDLDLEWWQTVPASQKVTAYALGLCFVATTCFWLSDLFWRFVDIPSVAFARRVENWMTRGADDPPTNPDRPHPASAVNPSNDSYQHYRRTRAASSGPPGHLRALSQQEVGGSKRKNG
ncbi:hypothetical protein A1O3_02688 [Capronia epimyces CBS 606.96]|uniref:Acyltransferase 3 domain-containing protein n=1 Tax=Capronia epimyces CBS 606.96 TaxID=1182542 RepID=W9YK46_9EURO|nr:uncharacterized protein A1O3_02688 [Capronia epimyces CBS 606.96]EXJ89621.1 hypothetical protein A1O3_02688 [Capronia epimyces CBS 606.96]